MNEDITKTSINLPNELIKKLDEDCNNEVRNRSEQIIYIIKKYYEKSPPKEALKNVDKVTNIE